MELSDMGDQIMPLMRIVDQVVTLVETPPLAFLAAERRRLVPK